MSSMLIPTYLSDLELPQVFAEYTQNLEDFLLQSRKSEHIVDSEEEKASIFVTPDLGQAEDLAKKFFAVENPDSRPFTLLQIDNGIIKTSTTKKCDCAIADDKNLCFIEFKANANSINRTNINRNYKKAMLQLAVTIDIFNRHFQLLGEDIKSKRKVEAYVCFRQSYPRSTSAQMNYRVRFAQENNGIPLSFIRKKRL